MFLLLSIDHFGECQFFRALGLSRYSGRARFFSFIWGSFATLGAPLLHWDQSLSIIRSILRDPHALSEVASFLPLALGLFLAALALGAAAWFDAFELKTTARSRTALPTTLLLVTSFLTLPLLAGFLCFFCFGHAADSIHQQMDKKNWRPLKYFQNALPLTSVSWISITCLMLCAGLNLGYLFVALGSLTLAHASVMKKFYRG